MNTATVTSAAIAVGTIGIVATIIGFGQQSRQEWTLKPGASDTARFTLERWRPGHRWSTTNEVPLSRFRGLPADPFAHFATRRFEYVADAGRLICVGGFSWSKGAGTYTFAPDPGFPSALQGLGYAAPDRD